MNLTWGLECRNTSELKELPARASWCVLKSSVQALKVVLSHFWDQRDKARNPPCSSPRLPVRMKKYVVEGEPRTDEHAERQSHIPYSALLPARAEGWHTAIPRSHTAQSNRFSHTRARTCRYNSKFEMINSRTDTVTSMQKSLNPTRKGDKRGAISPAGQHNLGPSVTLHGPALCVCVCEGECFHACWHACERRFP